MKSTPSRVVSVVLWPDGRLRFTSDRITPDDARRWVTEGSEVFRVASVDGSWVMEHVRSGATLDSESAMRVVTTDGEIKVHQMTPEPLALPAPSKMIARAEAEDVEAVARSFGALTPEAIRAAFGPCDGTLELIALGAKVREMFDDYDRFGKELEKK